MTAIILPRDCDSASSIFLKLGARKYLVISIVMVAALLDFDSDRRIRAARVAVGAASATAQRLRGLEARLVGAHASDDFLSFVTEADVAGLSPIDDVRATAGYRMDASRKLVARALAETAGRSHG